MIAPSSHVPETLKSVFLTWNMQLPPHNPLPTSITLQALGAGDSIPFSAKQGGSTIPTQMLVCTEAMQTEPNESSPSLALISFSPALKMEKSANGIYDNLRPHILHRDMDEHTPGFMRPQILLQVTLLRH